MIDRIPANKLRYGLFVCLFLWQQHAISAQSLLTRIPAEKISADSLAHYLYRQNNPDRAADKNGMESYRKYGWLKMSEKINTDSFYQWTKQYCIARVGEAYFYQHFRLDWRTLHEDMPAEIYEIRYIFMPFDTAALYLDEDSMAHGLFVFKSFDFMGIHELETPSNLPDCRENPSACRLPFDRAAVLKIVEARGLKSEKGYPPRLEFQSDLSWKVSINVNDWIFHQYSVDSRTGAVSEVKTSHRID